jgi:hypothetical protein
MDVPGTRDRPGEIAHSDLEGRFALHTHHRTLQRIWVSRPRSGALACFDVDLAQPVTQPLSLELNLGSITGEVRLPDGDLPNECAIELMPVVTDAGSPRPRPLHTVSRAVDGRFHFGGVPRGRYRLIGRRPGLPLDVQVGGPRGKSEPFDFSAGEARFGVQFVIAPE